MANVIQLLNEGLRDPNLLLNNVLLPFLLIFAIVWGALSMTKLFNPRINMVIALVLTIITSMTDAWGIIATQLALFSGVFTYVIFFGLFIVLVIMWAIGKGKSGYDENIYGTTKKDFTNLKEIDKQIAKVHKKMLEAQYRGDKSKAGTYYETWNELTETKKKLIKKLENERLTHGY